MTPEMLHANAQGARLELQRLAIAALDHVLVPGSGETGTPDAAIWPFLAGNDDLGFSARRAPMRARKLFIMSEPNAWSLYQRRRIPADRTLPDVLRRWGRFVDRIRRRPEIGLPEALPVLDAVAASAWAEAEFRTAVAVRIRRQLRVEVLMSPVPPSFPAVDPTLWWLLIAVRAGQGPLADRLRTKAATAAEGSDWAGFWEQYLVLRAARGAMDIGEAALGLPLVADGTEALRREPRIEQTQAVRSGWQTEAPGWAEALLDQTI